MVLDPRRRKDLRMSEQTEGNSVEGTTTPTNQPEHTVRRLKRREEGKLIAGVASGLGAYTGVDPVIFRIAFIVLAVAGGAGLLLYALGWLLIPSEASDQSVGEQVIHRKRGRGSTILGILLLAAGAIWLIGDAGLWGDPGDFGEVAWAIALIAIGVILLREDEKANGSVRPPQAAVSSTTLETRDQTLALPAAAAQTERRPKAPKSYLGRITLGIALMVLGTTAVLDNLGAFDASVEDYLALALAVVGGGLLVGAWRGRSRGLIVLGIVLLPLLFVSSLIDVPLKGGFGERFYRPVSIEDAAREYRLGAGKLEIDLGALAGEANPLQIRASVGAGAIRVAVPPGVRASVQAHSGAGHIEVFGRTQDGLDVDLDHSTGDASAGTILIDLDVGLGDVVVERTNGGTL
jgi:phage shock protein PspC (stress-responsive transcriptional regulator)